MTAFGVFYGLIQAAAYTSIAGSPPASRLAFGQQMESVGRQFSLFLPLPHGVSTIAAFIQWRVFGALPLLFGFWALMSAAGATRGDEERGLLEALLASGVGRARYLGTRVLIFTVAAAIAVGLTSAAIDVGSLGAGSALPLAPLLQVSISLLALTLCVYAMTVALAQLVVSRGAAAGLAGLVVGLMFFANSLSRSAESLKPIVQAISPFYYYDRSQPLAPGGSFDLAATGGLLLATLLLA